MLSLFLIRHAEAVSRDDPNFEDDDRPLTDAGRAAARALGAALAAKGVKFDAVLTSPLPRAKQTAEELLAGMGGGPELEEADQLAPDGKPRKLDQRLLRVEGEAVALVGHQPDLGDYLGRLIGAKGAQVKLEKPSAAFVACDEPPGKECGELVWLVTPRWFGPAEEPRETPILFADGRR